MTPQKTPRVVRTACLVALSLLALSASSPAETPRWVQATPFGGPVAALAQAPSAPRILYAVAMNGRVFRSLDGGATWNRRKGSIEDDFLIDLVVDPFDAGTLYARSAGFSHLFRTRDGGLTWSQIASELERVHALAPDRNHPGVLFAATPDGLYRSDDGGDSWVRVGLEGETVNGVAIDPRAPDTIFAMTAGDSFTQEPPLAWKSTDRGATWTSSVLPVAPNVSAGLARFVFDPLRPEVLYLAFVNDSSFGGLVVRSGDGGASWSQLPVAYVRDLAITPDGTLLAATEAGLERSSDGGATWVPPIDPDSIPTGGPPIDALTRVLVPSAAPGELFAAGSSGIWRSRDNGASWTTSNQGILAQGASDVAVAPTGPPAVFAVAGVALFRSSDQGESWTRLQSYFDGPQPYRIEAFDPRRPRTIYGIDTDGLAAFPVVSTNGGRWWSKLPIPYDCDNSGSICDVSLAMVVLDRDGSLLVGGDFFFHLQGRGGFLLQSADGGQTWRELAPIPQIGDVAIDPRRRRTYHAVACAGFFRSTDAGATWKKTGNGLPEHLCIDQRRPVLTIDPRNPQRFYVGTLNQGVFASADGGATFRAMNRGLEPAPVVSLLIDPTDSSKLYAGVAGQGVFQWNPERRKWTPLNRGLPLREFGGVIALDPRHPSILYAASPTEGVFRLDLEDPAP